MGLFSGKTKVYVASSVYNLAGDIKDRANYMKTTVISSMLTGNFAMSDTINRSYLNGPGIRMRLFSSWSKDKYDPYIGMAGGTIGVIASIDPAVVSSQIPVNTGSTVHIQSATIGFGDFQEWCDQYVYENLPSRINERFDIDINEDTNLITMTSLDGGSPVSFVPYNFEQGSLYLYADYFVYKSGQVDPPEVGPVRTYDNEDDLPSTLLWTTISKDNTPETTRLSKRVTVTATYSDGRPTETSTTDSYSDYTWDSYIKVYKRGFSSSPNESTIVIDNRVMTHKKIGQTRTDNSSSSEDIDIGGGIIKTVKTDVAQEYLATLYTSQSVTNNTTITAAGAPRMLIYKRGDGNAVLDTLFETEETDNRFYPFIPIRDDETWIEENQDMYSLCKKAMKKATGGKLPDVIKSLKDNDKIGDIQFIYGAFGCSLNSPENTAKEYIYRFFNMATAAFPTDPRYPTMEAVIAGYEEANKQAEAYAKWWADNTGGGSVTSTPPPLPEYPTIPRRSFRVYSDKGYKYDMTIAWSFVFETSHSGQGWPGAKQSELKSRYAGDVTLNQIAYRVVAGESLVESTIPTVLQEYELLWQTSATTYKRLRLFGLVHSNRVYKNKYVNIDVAEAMSDLDESGFIIPLHTNIYRSMSLTHSTQLSTACTYLVMNSYKKVKEKWYATSAFKVVVIVVAIVISAFSFGAGGAGILGAYGTVGAALGFTGLAALIVGAIANTIAAIVLISIIQAGSIALFGDKLGAIIGAVASVVAMSAGTALATGSTISGSFGSMMNATNIAQLTSSVGNGISKYINATTMETIRKTESIMQQYTVDSRAVQDKYEELFGSGSMGKLDPMDFVNTESLDIFLTRTLLTGSDIADMSLNMISSFGDLTLDTKLT